LGAVHDIPVVDVTSYEHDVFHFCEALQRGKVSNSAVAVQIEYFQVLKAGKGMDIRYFIPVQIK